MDEIKKQLRYLMIGLFAVAGIALIVAFCAAFMGTHETKFTLPDNKTFAIEGSDTPTEATLNGHYIKGYRVDSNEMALNIAITVLLTCGASGTAILLIEG